MVQGAGKETKVDKRTVTISAHIYAFKYRNGTVEFFTVSQTPIQFNSTGGAPCGTLIIWTQG